MRYSLCHLATDNLVGKTCLEVMTVYKGDPKRHDSIIPFNKDPVSIYEPISI